jgi:hypothetical protein
MLPFVRKDLFATLLLVLGAMLLVRTVDATEEAANLEVHEWSVWIGEPQGKQFNGAADFPTTMPGLVDSERSRKRDPAKPKPSPLGLMTIYGTPPEVVDVDLRITAGRPISQWPRSEGKSNRLRWLDLTVSKELTNQELLAYIPETHWFHQARSLGGLYLQLKKGGRAERFFAYDLELQTPLNVRLDGGPDQYRIANLGKHPIHDVVLILPEKDGTRIGWLDTVSPTPSAAEEEKKATGDNKPAGVAAGQAQPVAAVAVAAAGANQPVVAKTAEAAPANAAAAEQKPGEATPAAKSGIKDILAKFSLTGPFAADSDDFKQKTDVEMRRRLAETGLTPAEIKLLMSLYAEHFFATDELHLVFRMSQPGIDDVTPLTVEPDTAKIKRVALVIARKVDPRLREDVQKLMVDLADASYAKREQAEKKLKDLGNLAIPSLKEALKSKDPEVVMRAERILLSHKEQLGADQQPEQ